MCVGDFLGGVCEEHREGYLILNFLCGDGRVRRERER